MATYNQARWKLREWTDPKLNRGKVCDLPLRGLICGVDEECEKELANLRKTSLDNTSGRRECTNPMDRRKDKVIVALTTGASHSEAMRKGGGAVGLPYFWGATATGESIDDEAEAPFSCTVDMVGGSGGGGRR